MTRKKADSDSNSSSYVNKEDRIAELIKRSQELLVFYETEQDSQKGLACLNEAIELGSMEAVYHLGQAYEYGWSSKVDIPKAIELYTQAADKKYEPAISQLADLYYNYDDIEEHFSLAMSVIKKYAKFSKGHIYYLRGLMHWYGQGVTNSTTLSLHYLEIAADYGKHYEAIKLLEQYYEYGHKPNYDKNDYNHVQQDLIKAAKYHEMAAHKGDKESQYKAAMVKLEGKGTSKDYQGAFLWLWQSALQSYGFAQYVLAKFYISEYLFPRDVSMALLWALISQNNVVSKEAQELIDNYENSIPRAQLTKLQKAAIKLNKDMKQVTEGGSEILLSPERYLELYGFAVDDKASPAIPKYDATDICLPEQETTQTNNDTSAQIKQDPFIITDIKKLAITLYTNSDKVKLVYENNDITMDAGKLLSPNCIELLKRHDKHLNYHERAVSYYASDIHDATKPRKRSNKQIVYDFNHAIRKYFELDSKIKPFEWIGFKANRTLKANFTLKVDYKPKKQGKPQSS